MENEKLLKNEKKTLIFEEDENEKDYGVNVEKENVINISDFKNVKHENELINFRDVYRRRLVFSEKMPKAKGGYFNLSFKNTLKSKFVFDFFHQFVDLTWWKILLLFTLLYFLFHFIFGFLYFICGVIDRSSVTSLDVNIFFLYLYCFFFSVNILATNGTFGIIVPTTVYSNSIVVVESFFTYFFETFLIAIIVGKITRPSLLKRNYLFSKNAVLKVSKNSRKWKISFRFYNLRTAKSTLMSSSINLLLILWDDQKNGNDQTKDKKNFKIYEIDYSLYKQTKRSFEIGYSSPALPLPMIISHTIDESSPFFQFIKEKDSIQLENNLPLFELIVVIEGVDSSTSCSYQTIKSYTQSEIVVNQTFEKCVYFSKEQSSFVLDFKKFSRLKKCERLNKN